MSCERPLTLPTNAKYFTPGLDNLYNRADCGTCASCRKRKRDDLYVRTRFEFADCLNIEPFTGNPLGKPGFSLFPTLTYKTSQLPSRFQDGFPIVGFSYDDIRSFYDTINHKFKRKYKTDDSIRYLICCEFGNGNLYEHKGAMRLATFRPHYHALFFFPAIALEDMAFWIGYLKFVWENLHGKGWLSYPDPQKQDFKLKIRYPDYLRFPKELKEDCIAFGESVKHLASVNHFEALKYVSKYAEKDESIFHQPQLDAYLYRDDIPNKRFWNDYSIEERLRFENQYKERISKIRDMLPASPWKSPHFGESMVSYLAQLPYEKRKDMFLNGVSWIDDVNEDHTQRFFNIPTFVKRKFTYEYHTTEIINPATGRACHPVTSKSIKEQARVDAERMYFDELKKASFNLRKNCSALRILSEYTDEDIKRILTNQRYVSISNREQLLDFYNHIFANYSPEYLISYRHISRVSFDFDTSQYIESLDDDDFIDFAADYAALKRSQVKQIPIQFAFVDKLPNAVSFNRSVKARYNSDEFHNYIVPDIECFFDVVQSFYNEDSRVRLKEACKRERIRQEFKQLKYKSII